MWCVAPKILPASLLLELAVAVPGMVGLVTFEVECLAGQVDAERYDRQKAIPEGAADVAPGRALHAKADAAEARAGQHVAARPEAGEDHQRQDGKERQVEDRSLHDHFGRIARAEHIMQAEP